MATRPLLVLALLITSQCGDGNAPAEGSSPCAAAGGTHPDELPVAVSFAPPASTACQGSTFAVSVWGLQRQACYAISVLVRRGTVVVHDSSVRISASPTQARSSLSVHLPPLSAGEHSVRVSVIDAFDGSAGASILSTMVRPLHVQSAELGTETACAEARTQGRSAVCIIDGTCAKYSEWTGQHDDSDFAYAHLGVGKTAVHCLARAREWFLYCENPPSLPITAKFVPTGDEAVHPDVRQTLSHAEKAPWVMLLHVTDGFLDFLDNFLLHYRKIPEWSVKHEVKVIVTSQAAAHYISSTYGDALEVSVGRRFGKHAHGFLETGFCNVVHERINIILDELERGNNVLYIDIDTVLLKDPFPHLLPGYDVGTIMDHSFVHCTGFMAFMPTRRAFDLLSEWKQLLLEAGQQSVNQEIFNELIRADDNVDLGIYKLSMEKFPPGNVYFSPDLDGQDQVVLVHNNFIVGHDAKRRRFQDRGLWLTPDSSQRDPPHNSAGPNTSHEHRENLHRPEARMRSAQDALASSGNRQRSIPESRQEAEPLFKRLPYPVKHPDEQPVSMGLTPWNLKFAAEAWIRLSVSFYGLVEGASYHVDVSVADQGILLEDQRIVFVPKAVSDTTVINIPPLNKTGNFVLQVSLVDRFPGLDVDLALIATSGRHMEVWSEGCGARLIWPHENQPDFTAENSCSSARTLGAEHGVTLATIASIDRLAQALSVAERWEGPISLALHASCNEEAEEITALVHGPLSTWFRSRAYPVRVVLVSACFADAHHAMQYVFPVNVLRHHAVVCAPTETVFYIDVDFVPSHGAARLVEQAMKGMDPVMNVLVVPCFIQADRANSTWPPHTVMSVDEYGQLTVAGGSVSNLDIMQQVKSGKLVVPGDNHGATEYHRWLHSSASDHAVARAETFEVSYTLGWEPYVVINKRHWNGTLGLFDKRFRNRGWDKASFIYELAVRGYSFRTLAGASLVHATESNLKMCPTAFGGKFCQRVALPRSDWLPSQGSIETFCSFVQSLAKERNNSMPASHPHTCMIYPFHVLGDLPTTFLRMFLTQAYQARDQSIEHIERQVAATFRNRSSLLIDHWEDFAKLWCVSVPGLVGQIMSAQCSEGDVIKIVIDTRIWEAYPFKESSTGHNQTFRHYLRGPSELTPLTFAGRKSSFQVELIGRSKLVHACAETEEGSRLWQCSIESILEGYGRDGRVESDLPVRLFHLGRESLLHELHDFHDPGLCKDLQHRKEAQGPEKEGWEGVRGRHLPSLASQDQECCQVLSLEQAELVSLRRKIDSQRHEIQQLRKELDELRSGLDSSRH